MKILIEETYGRWMDGSKSSRGGWASGWVDMYAIMDEMHGQVDSWMFVYVCTCGDLFSGLCGQIDK